MFHFVSYFYGAFFLKTFLFQTFSFVFLKYPNSVRFKANWEKMFENAVMAGQFAILLRK